MRLFYAMNFLLLVCSIGAGSSARKPQNKQTSGKKEFEQSQTDFMIFLKLRPNLIVFRCLCNELTFIVNMCNQLDIYVRFV